MSSRIFRLFIPLTGAIFISLAVWLFWVDQANAQCGSQASSCKNCHEVQGQLSVNNDGTGWHQSHAFGDFCANCHAGNVQATDKDTAHTGMVAPLSDLNANCAACHPSDLVERGQVYASILGVTLDAGGTNPPAASGGDSPAPADSGQPAANPPASSIVVNDAEVIDYAQRYEQTANGALNVNWGDVIVGALLVAVVAGGGVFVYFNEMKLRGKLAAKPESTAAPTKAAPIRLEDYPPEVVALLPQIAKLNPVGLHALKRLLDNPDDASELLHSLSRLDPELVHRIRSLDRDSRALLMGLAGD